MVRAGSIRAHVDSFIPGMFNAAGEVWRLPAGALPRIHALGPLVLGAPGEPSLFGAVVALARARREVRELLASKATPIGRAVDDALLAAAGDPFFESIPVFRPDLLVTPDGRVLVAELEIVVGDVIHLGIVQQYLGRRTNVVGVLLDGLRAEGERFGSPGAPALIFDRHGEPLFDHHALIESRFDRRSVVARLSELTFRDDGVYRGRTRIGAAYVFLKNHKLSRGCQPEGERLLRAWLDRRIVLAPPPSLLLDNKILSWLLQAPRYAADLGGLLGAPRLEALRAYLPRTWLLDRAALSRSKTARALVEEPWERGRFVYKFPSLWGSRDIAVSPLCPSPRWRRRIERMLDETLVLGPLVCQEAIETYRMKGRTKAVPFFFRPSPGEPVACADVGLYRMSGPWAVHRTPASCLGIVEDP
jgi:hypothetical protein